LTYYYILFLGCNNETFSCGDWDIVLQRSSCFERQNRCDYIKNCPNGRDEDECTLLSRHLENPNQVSLVKQFFFLNKPDYFILGSNFNFNV